MPKAIILISGSPTARAQAPGFCFRAPVDDTGRSYSSSVIKIALIVSVASGRYRTVTFAVVVPSAALMLMIYRPGATEGTVYEPLSEAALSTRAPATV